jgi:IS30 family transposase
VAPKKAGNTESVAIAAERITKLLVGTKIPSLSPVHMQEAVEYMDAEVDIKSLTMDNGIENRSHEAWNIPTFFADQHAPWQKPLVENNIGLIRRWFMPKGTDFATIPESLLQQYFSIINHKYRKSLNYKSAYEVALLHGIIKKIP